MSRKNKDNFKHKKLTREEKLALKNEKLARKRERLALKKEEKKQKQLVQAEKRRTPYVEPKFNFDTIHGIPLKEVDYVVPPRDVRDGRREQFKEIKSNFMKFMAEKHEDKLKVAGFTHSEIEHIKITPIYNDETGLLNRLCPKRYNVHHKLPIHGGGKNEFSNFIIMPLAEHANLHEKVIDRYDIIHMHDGETRKVKIPWTDDMAFTPTNLRSDYDKSKDFESMSRSNNQRGKPKQDFYGNMVNNNRGR